MVYFENIDIEDISTDVGKAFINELSGLLDEINPSLVDKEKIKIVITKDKDDEFISVFIPHITNRNLNLNIEFDEAVTTITVANGSFNFHDYENDVQRIEDTINLVSKIMKGLIEIHTFYKGTKLVKIQPYFVSQFGELEPFQCSYYNFLSLLNPFIRIRKIVERGSFSC
jgi:hypothetical protein